MSHSCPECGQYCCCDLEDHENDDYEDCDHYLTRECRGDEGDTYEEEAEP